MKSKTIKAPPVKPAASSLAPPERPEPPPAAGAEVDVALVRALAEIVSREALTELRVRTKDALIILRREAAPAAPAAPALHPVAHPPPPLPFHGAPAHTMAAHPVPPPLVQPPPSSPPAATDDGRFVFVSSPFVGTFYRSPSPEAPMFVEVGQQVHKGQVLCIVEAMKLMNEIEAETDGTIVAVLVENAQPVEYGQQLFKISP
jgi:acetyl-CoA carboxylase biotin carboxyl carrier protein